MNWWGVFKYTALLIGGVILVTTVVGIALGILGTVFGLLWAVVGLLVSLIVPAVSLAVVAAIIYGAVTLLSGDSTGEASVKSRSTTTTDPVERAKERYAAGEISEQELERRLELELGGPDRDSIDRELERE